MAISRNTSLNFGLDTVGNYTVGSGSNRLLVLALMGDATDQGPHPTFNGVAMTLVAQGSSGGDRYDYLFYLLAPTSGTHAFAITWDLGIGHFVAMLADYDGVAQSAQPDAFAQGSGAQPLTVTPTVVAANSWVIAANREAGAVTTTWTGITELQASNGTHLGDSNGAVAAGAYTVTASSSGQETYLIAASFAPAAAGGDLTLALTGQASTSAIGTVTASATGDVSAALTGRSTTSAFGTVTASATGDVSLALTGRSVTSISGSVVAVNATTTDVNTLLFGYLHNTVYVATPSADLTTLLARRITELTGEATARLHAIIQSAGGGT